MKQLLPTSKFHSLTKSKTNMMLVGALVVVVILAIFGATKIFSKASAPVPLQEVDLPFDPQGPYALLVPRRDGNALVLNINRVSSYDAISYEMAYSSDGIDRGVQGKLNTNDKKNEYSQEILFGTCSKGNTADPLHCVFDKNVENGTLLLKIQKGTILYKMNTTWHLQKPDIALGVMTSGDSHFTYKTDASRQDLALLGYSIVNDLSGMPKLPADKTYVGKVYALNGPTAKSFPKGVVSIELADKPAAGTKIARYNDGKNDWDILDTKVNGSTLTSNVDASGIFAVLTPVAAK